MSDEERERIEALEWMVARLVAQVQGPAMIRHELEELLPSAMYTHSPAEHRYLPHYERVLRMALALLEHAASSKE